MEDGRCVFVILNVRNSSTAAMVPVSLSLLGIFPSGPEGFDRIYCVHIPYQGGRVASAFGGEGRTLRMSCTVFRRSMTRQGSMFQAFLEGRPKGPGVGGRTEDGRDKKNLLLVGERGFYAHEWCR